MLQPSQRREESKIIYEVCREKQTGRTAMRQQFWAALQERNQRDLEMEEGRSNEGAAMAAQSLRETQRERERQREMK